MSVDSPPRRMTIDEFLDLPERRTIERWLIRGQLTERKATFPNPWHSAALMNLGLILGVWLRQQTRIKATLVGGDAGFRFQKDPDSFVGIDAALVKQGTPLFHHGKKAVFDAPPLLAVEITSPSDRQDDIDSKVDAYLAANVPLVWIVNPHQKTVTVFRPDAEPVLYAQSAELTGEPHLPGLAFRVAEIFAGQI